MDFVALARSFGMEAAWRVADPRDLDKAPRAAPDAVKADAAAGVAAEQRLGAATGGPLTAPIAGLG